MRPSRAVQAPVTPGPRARHARSRRSSHLVQGVLTSCEEAGQDAGLPEASQLLRLCLTRCRCSGESERGAHPDVRRRLVPPIKPAVKKSERLL